MTTWDVTTPCYWHFASREHSTDLGSPSTQGAKECRWRFTAQRCCPSSFAAAVEGAAADRHLRREQTHQASQLMTVTWSHCIHGEKLLYISWRCSLLVTFSLLLMSLSSPLCQTSLFRAHISFSHLPLCLLPFLTELKNRQEEKKPTLFSSKSWPKCKSVQANSESFDAA